MRNSKNWLGLSALVASLIPALRALSEMDIKNGSINVTLLDLERRKVSFNQEAASQLDWTRLRSALSFTAPPTRWPGLR